jgi:hypothetical protein
LLAAIVTLEHMQYYIDGQRVTLETDHNNLRWIMNIKNPQGKLARWITRLSCYDVHFFYIAKASAMKWRIVCRGTQSECY